MPVVPGSSRTFTLRCLRLPLISIGAALAMSGTGCERREEAAEEMAATGRHPVTGVVVMVDGERHAALVQHDEIPGVMPAMTMEFLVREADLPLLREGLSIRATMYQSAAGYHLEGIWPAELASEKIVKDAVRSLRQDTVARGRSAFREVGESLPDFALYDQTGRVVQAARFRGRQIVINFIFTRCPDANMCPASTAKMIELQALAREAGVTDLELVSITMDPEFDTPGVLRAYAEGHQIDTANFSFLTGPEAAIKDLMAQLGILAFGEGPLIRHTLTTVLVDGTGRIVHRVDGSQWQPADFAGRLRQPVAASPP